MGRDDHGLPFGLVPLRYRQCYIVDRQRPRHQHGRSHYPSARRQDVRLDRYRHIFRVQSSI